MSNQDWKSLYDIDQSVRYPVLFFYASAVFWLLAGSILAIVASVKLHTPGFLDQCAWLTFGRVRPAHLNTVIYGWASMASIGTLWWMQARLARVTMRGPWLGVAIGVGWNIAVAAGTIAILGGCGTSVEWLEFPIEVASALAALFAGVAYVSIDMFLRRKNSTGHLYVSQWYLLGAILWFPFLYIVAHFMIHWSGVRGVAQATANWWFAHNVLGIWFTPISLATAYYLIPKVTGRPIHSYYLSLLGFWTLAIFYNWAGSHHLIGGPLPVWITTVGTMASMMMFVPVTTVALNHHLTMRGEFWRLRYSPTLRFVVFGAMTYTVVSFQGSLEALRVVNEVAHFTHFTIAHAHLGMYGFVSMMAFGAMYFAMPRLTGREWSSPKLVSFHFWTTAGGMILYFVGLTIGGWYQGMNMNNPDMPFLETVARTIPWLWSRSVAGTIMTLGHFAFAILVWRMLTGKGPMREGPLRLRGEHPSDAEEAV